MRMHIRLFGVVAILAVLAACERPRPDADPDLATEIDGIKAIDNHAHPVLVTANGEKPDRDFDALPVDNMEPQSDPVNLRPGAPAMLDAAKALSGKQQAMREKGEQYPAWVLDQMGVGVMLANRVEMGPGIQPPRFLWVAYADALIFPLDNAKLAANPDRKAFFALEDVLRGRYLAALGLKTVPATLGEYLARVVTPTLERQRAGGAVAEKFEAAYLRSLEFDKVERGAAEAIYARFWDERRGGRSRIQAAPGFSVPLHRRGMRPAGHGRAFAHQRRRGRILPRRRRQSAAARNRVERSGFA